MSDALLLPMVAMTMRDVEAGQERWGWANSSARVLLRVLILSLEEPECLWWTLPAPSYSSLSRAALGRIRCGDVETAVSPDTDYYFFWSLLLGIGRVGAPQNVLPINIDEMLIAASDCFCNWNKDERGPGSVFV